MDSFWQSNELYLKGLITMMEHLNEPWALKIYLHAIFI